MGDGKRWEMKGGRSEKNTMGDAKGRHSRDDY